MARLHLETEDKARAAFEGDVKVTYHLAPPLLSNEVPNGRQFLKTFWQGILSVF